MAYNGTTIPTGRDNTYNPDEIRRKSSEEKYETAFNDEQKSVIEDMASNISVLSSSIEEIEGVIDAGFLPEVTSDDNGNVLTVVEGVWDKAAGSSAAPTPLIFEKNATTPTGEEVYNGFINGVPCLFKEVDGDWISYMAVSAAEYYNDVYYVNAYGSQLAYDSVDGWQYAD